MAAEFDAEEESGSVETVWRKHTRNWIYLSFLLAIFGEVVYSS